MATKLIQKIDWMLVKKALYNVNELSALPDNPKIAYSHYDDGVDVLYIHFVSPFNPTDSEMLDNDVLVDYDEENKVIGLTILDFQARLAENITSNSLCARDLNGQLTRDEVGKLWKGGRPPDAGRR